MSEIIPTTLYETFQGPSHLESFRVVKPIPRYLQRSIEHLVRNPCCVQNAIPPHDHQSVDAESSLTDLAKFEENV